MTHKAKLYLCGLGHFPPYTASLNALHSLSRCDLVVSHGSDAHIPAFLKEFRLGAKRIFCGEKKGAASAAEVALRELRKGKNVGLVTRAHPLLFDGPAAGLARRCAKEAIGVEVFGSVSSIDMVLARLNKTLGVDMHGVQSYAWEALESLGVVNFLQPMVVVFGEKALTPKQVAKLGRSLGKFYPSRHYCWMFGPAYDDAPQAFCLEDMGFHFPEIAPSRILYVPPL